MIERFSVQTFKSLEDVTVALGRVNVFIGANGSGKSNLLEALGILSAAANGKVDEQALLARGVRPGVPNLYKSAFPAKPGTGIRILPHLSFGAYSSQAEYQVCLLNNLEDQSGVVCGRAQASLQHPTGSAVSVDAGTPCGGAQPHLGGASRCGYRIGSCGRRIGMAMAATGPCATGIWIPTTPGWSSSWRCGASGMG
ncbi:MAG: AAA family ATPase [Synechococcus sp. SB0662_bin_14]|nr:AAA family ATPase [Synechococcus sp. SB0662_bin_14]